MGEFRYPIPRLEMEIVISPSPREMGKDEGKVREKKKVQRSKNHFLRMLLSNLGRNRSIAIYLKRILSVFLNTKYEINRIVSSHRAVVIVYFFFDRIFRVFVSLHTPAEIDYFHRLAEFSPTVKVGTLVEISFVSSSIRFSYTSSSYLLIYS